MRSLTQTVRQMLAAALVLASGIPYLDAQTTTYSGATGAFNNDTWNDPANWDNGVPAGTTDVVIAAGEYAAAGAGTTPVYQGDLTLENGAGLLIGQSSGADDENIFGTGTIFMNNNTRITFRHNTLTLPQQIDISGFVRFNLSESSAGHHTQRHFNGPVSGVGTMRVYSANNNDLFLGASNSFEGLIIITNGGSTLNASANFSLGQANVQVDNGSSLIIASSLNDVMSDRAELFLNGGGDSGSAAKMVMNSPEKVGTLTIDGDPKAAGTWGAPGSGATYQTNTFSGSGILTVRWYSVPAAGTVISLR